MERSINSDLGHLYIPLKSLLFSNNNFFVGQAGGWITSLWQDISALLSKTEGRSTAHMQCQRNISCACVCQATLPWALQCGAIFSLPKNSLCNPPYPRAALRLSPTDAKTPAAKYRLPQPLGKKSIGTLPPSLQDQYFLPRAQ